MVNKIKIKAMKYLLIMGIITALGCTKEYFKDDELSIKKTNYTGNQLRIDGYYYQKQNSTIYSIYFLFKNGVLSYGGGRYNTQELLELELEFKNNEFYNYIKNNRTRWGVFEIINSSIKFERWYPSNGFTNHAYIRAGKILNDTTFQITESYRMQNGKKTEVDTENEIYYFKQFSPKPDSTNRFTK